jgi:hypothetical protein
MDSVLVVAPQFGNDCEQPGLVLFPGALQPEKKTLAVIFEEPSGAVRGTDVPPFGTPPEHPLCRSLPLIYPRTDPCGNSAGRVLNMVFGSTPCRAALAGALHPPAPSSRQLFDTAAAVLYGVNRNDAIISCAPSAPSFVDIARVVRYHRLREKLGTFPWYRQHRAAICLRVPCQHRGSP